MVINKIHTCPNCEESIASKEKPKACPNCNFKFNDMDYDDFLEPLTIHEQGLKLKNEAGKIAFINDLPMETVESILQDTLSIIQLLPGKKTQQPDIRNVVELAIQIGEIAKAYKTFLSCGGVHGPALIITAGETNESQTPRDGKSSSAGKPTPLFSSMEQANGGGGWDTTR